MVNSGSFDTDEDRNGKSRYLQVNDAATSSQSSCAGDDAANTDKPADSDLPSDASAIEPTPTKTEVNSEASTEASQKNVFNKKDETGLCCSLPSRKVHSTLTRSTPPSDNLIAEDKLKRCRKLLCLYCDRSFVSANLRQKHVERVHTIKPTRRVSARRQNQLSATTCVHCDKLNSSEHTLNDLFQHLVQEHPTKYFGCLSCEERFLTSSFLAVHNASKHCSEENLDNTQNSPISPQIDKTGDDNIVNTEEVPLKVTRSKLRNKLSDTSNSEVSSDGQKRKKKSKIKELRSKKISVKTSKIALKRSKRLQAQTKESESQKKRREKKVSNANKSETINNTKQTEKSKSTCINPYPEFDNFYRVKKITDHSIDNLKINSLTFDDVFDKAFFNRIRCNIEENLLHHIDGKLFKNEESESRISNFEKISTTPQDIQQSSSENYGCELSLNAVTPIPALSLNPQFGEDFESQIEYGSKPSKKKTQTRSDEVHYKYFTRRKYQASILQQKENRDLSKLDMWTQMVVKDRQEKVLNKKKNAKEIQDYTSGQEYKNKLKMEELNRILDKRGPFEDLKEEASKMAAFDKLNSSSESSISPEVFTDVREVLNEILDKVFESVKEDDCPPESFSKEIDHREIPAYLDLRRKNSSTQEEIIDKSDRIALICSSQETENYELPTNTVRGKNELIELTGEWARSRMYICAACGGKFSNIKYLIEHRSVYHQNVWVQNYEFVGNQSELYRHLSIPGLGKVGVVENTIPCKLWKRSEARTCTKCGKVCNSLGELHRHVLECGGDWTWMLARKKCKYRPFGAKSRRKRRGLLPRTFNKQKTEPSEKKNSKKTIEGPRQRPSDADTIQRMLANLPAKRSRRSLISLRDVVFKSRKNKQGNKSQTTKIKCGKSVCKKQQTESIKSNTLQQRNRRSMRSLNKVLSSRILDLNSSLIVKRKLQVFRDRRSTKNQKQTNVTDIASEEDDSFINSDIQTSEKCKLPKKNQTTTESTKTEDKNLVTDKKKTLAKKMLTGRLNIKNFFPIKKKSARSKQQKTVLDQLPNSYNENDEHKHNSETRSLYLENSQNMKKNKRGGLKGFVRALSLRKRNSKCDETTDSDKNISKTTKAQLNPGSPKKVGRPRTKQANIDKLEKDGPKMESSSDNVDIDEEASKKRKVQRGFRSVINKVKKIKTDKTPAKLTENMLENNSSVDANTKSFLEEKNLNQIIIPPEGNVISAKMEEKTLEKKDHAHIVDDQSSSVINTCLSEIPISLPEKTGSHTNTVGVLGDIPNNKDLVSPKNDYCLLDPHHNITPVTIDTSLKPKCIPLVSPNIKGKIRKPNRGLNDCIAMLTNKLQQKDEKISSSLESLFSTSSTISTERTETHQMLESNPQPAKHQKNEFILKIPSFKATKSKIIEEESALDLSKKSFSSPNLLYPHSNNVGFIESTINKVIEGVIEHKCKEVLNEKFTTSAWSSVDDIIQQVVQNTSSVSFNSSVNKKTLPVRTHVDDTIDFVVNSSNDWFENKINPVEEKRKSNKKSKKRRNSDDNLIKDIILGKDKLIIAPSSNPHNALENSLIAKIKENESKLSVSSNNLCEIIENHSDCSNLISDSQRTDCYNSTALSDDLLPDSQKSNTSCKTKDRELNISRSIISTVDKIDNNSSSQLLVDKVLEEKSESVQNVILDDKKQTDIEIKYKADFKKDIETKNETSSEEQILLSGSIKLKCPDLNVASARSNIDNDLMQDNLKPIDDKNEIKEINIVTNLKKSSPKLTSQYVIETNIDDHLNDTAKLKESKTNSLIEICTSETMDKNNESMELSTEDEPIILENKALEKSLKLLNSDSEDEVPLALIAKQEGIDNPKQSNVLQILKPGLKSDLEKSADTETKTELLEVSSSSSKLEEKPLDNEKKNSNPVNVTKDIVENLTGDSLKENIEQEVNRNENTSKSSKIAKSINSLKRRRKRNHFRSKKFTHNKRKTKIENVVDFKIQSTPVLSNIKSNSLVIEEGSSIDNNLELPKDNQSDLPKEEAVCNEPLNIYPEPVNVKNTKINEPIKILINKQRTRRKSKSSKKVEKFNNDLFKDFSLVINKKTKRIPPTCIVDDSVCDDVLDKSINSLVNSLDVSKVENIKPPEDSNELQLNDSVEEMDMEIEDIPINTNIIERDNKQITAITSQEEINNIFDITVDIQNEAEITAARKSPRKKCMLNANNESTFIEKNNVKMETKQSIFKRTRRNQAEDDCLNKTYIADPLEESEEIIEKVLNIVPNPTLENTQCQQISAELDCRDAIMSISSTHNDSEENTKGNHNSQYENGLDENIKRNIQENILPVQQETNSPTKITEDLVINNSKTSKHKTLKKKRKSRSNLKVIKNGSKNEELCIHQEESEIDNPLVVLVSLKRNRKALKRNKKIIPDKNEKTEDFSVVSLEKQEIGHTIVLANKEDMIPEITHELQNENRSTEMTDQLKDNNIGESFLENIDLSDSQNSFSIKLPQQEKQTSIIQKITQKSNTESFTEFEKEFAESRPTKKNTTVSDNTDTTIEETGLISENKNSVPQLHDEQNIENVSEDSEIPLKFNIISYAADMSSKVLDLQNACNIQNEYLKTSLAKKVSKKQKNIKKGTMEYPKNNYLIANNTISKKKQNSETLDFFEKPFDESTPKKNGSQIIKNSIETEHNTNLFEGLSNLSSGDGLITENEVETEVELFKCRAEEPKVDSQVADILTNRLLKTNDDSAVLNADKNMSTPEISEVMNASTINHSTEIKNKSRKTMKNKIKNPAFCEELLNLDDKNKNGRKIRKSRRSIKKCLEPPINKSNALLVEDNSKNYTNSLSSPEVNLTKITTKSKEFEKPELNSHDSADTLTTCKIDEASSKNSNTSIQKEIPDSQVADNWDSNNISLSLESDIEDSGFLEKTLGDSPEKRPHIKLSHNFESPEHIHNVFSPKTIFENESNKKNPVDNEFLSGETQEYLEENRLETKKVVPAPTKKKRKGFKGTKNKLKRLRQKVKQHLCSPKISDQSYVDILPDVSKTDSEISINESAKTEFSRKVKRTNKSKNYEKLSIQNDSKNKNIIQFIEVEKLNSGEFLEKTSTKEFVVDSGQLLGSETEINAKDRDLLCDYDSSLWGLRRSSRNKNQKSADILESKSNDISNEKSLRDSDITSIKSNTTIQNVERYRKIIDSSVSYDNELKIIPDLETPHNIVNPEAPDDLISSQEATNQTGITKRPRKNIDYNEENMEKRAIHSTENQEIKDHPKEYKNRRQQKNKNVEKTLSVKEHTFFEPGTLKPSRDSIPNNSALVSSISQKNIEKQNKSEIINDENIIAQELPPKSNENSDHITIDEKHKSTVESDDKIISNISLLTDFTEMPKLIVDLELIDEKYDGLLKSSNYEEKKAEETNNSLDSFGFHANIVEKIEEDSQKNGSVEIICQSNTKEDVGKLKKSRINTISLSKKEKQQKRFINSNSLDKDTKSTKDLDIFNFEEPVTQNMNEDICGNTVEAPEHLELLNPSFTEFFQSRRDRRLRTNINYNEEKLQNSNMDSKKSNELTPAIKINLKNSSDNFTETEQITTKNQNSKKPPNEFEFSEEIKNEEIQLSQPLGNENHHLPLRQTRKSRKNVVYNEEILSKTIETEKTANDNLKNTLDMDNETSKYNTDNATITVTSEEEIKTNNHHQSDLHNLRAVEAQVASKIDKKKERKKVTHPKKNAYDVKPNTAQSKVDSLKNADSKSSDLHLDILATDQKAENCPKIILDTCTLPSESMQKSLDNLMENLEIHRSENVDCIENANVSEISILNHQEVSKMKKIKKNIMDIDIANILDTDCNSENRRSSRNRKTNSLDKLDKPVNQELRQDVVNFKKSFWDIEVNKTPEIFSENKNELTDKNKVNEKELRNTSYCENQDNSSPDRDESLSLINKVTNIFEDLKGEQSELNIFKTTELMQNSDVNDCVSDYINNSKDSLPVISNSITDEVFKNNDHLDNFSMDKSNYSNLDLSISDAINTEELILESETVTSCVKNKRKGRKQKDIKTTFGSSQDHESKAIDETENIEEPLIMPKKNSNEDLFSEQLGQMCNLANSKSDTPSKAQKLDVHSQENEDYDIVDPKTNLEEDDFQVLQNSIIKSPIPRKSKSKKLKQKVIIKTTPPTQDILQAFNKSLQTNSKLPSDGNQISQLQLSEKINFTALQNVFRTISKPGKKNKRKKKGVCLAEIEPLTDIITCSEMDIAPVLDEIDKSLESEDIYDFNAEAIDEIVVDNKKNSNKGECEMSLKMYCNNGQQQTSDTTNDYLEQLGPLLDKPTRRNSRKSKVKALENIHEKGLVELDDFASKINVGREQSKKRSKSLNALKEDKKVSLQVSKQLIEKSDRLSLTTTNSENDAVDVTRTFLWSSSENLHTAKVEDGCFHIFNNIKENESQDLEITKPNLEQNISEISERNNQAGDITDGQELRRSRRGSRKVASYNENDLIDPLIEAMETRRNRSTKKDRSTEKCPVKKEVHKDLSTEKAKLNSEELFDILKNTTNENEDVNILKPRNFFLENLNAPTSNTDLHFEESDSKLEKPSYTPNNTEKVDVDKIYEFTEDSPDATQEFCKNKRRANSNQQKLLEDSKTNFVCTNTIENSVENSSGEPQEKNVVTEKSNFCEICNKTFIRVENLIKHKTTLTHISKLSELEAKEVEERTKVEIDKQNLEDKSDLIKRADSLRNEINIQDILQPSERTHENSPSVINNHQLNLVDIISDVLNKPVLENYSSEKHSRPDRTNKNTYKGDIRRYKSLGERKSFESENQLSRISTPLSQTYLSSMSKTTILENQINLLENIIGNKLENLVANKSETENNYIEELSSCSNDSIVAAADNNSCASNKSFNPNSGKNNMNSHADFVKPSQYEEISEDSANVRVYEDSKLRKTLNRDEELFLECCSLLKSGSEVSNSNYSKNLKKPLNSNKELDETNSINNKKLIQTVEEAHEYSDNSRTPTPLGDTYDDEASNSNTISSNWNLKSEKPLDKNRSFSFEEVVNKEEAGISFGEVLTKGLRNQFEYMNHPEERTQHDQAMPNTTPIDRKYDSDSSTKSKKISTKGARKVFEGLKVSIPTEDLNLDVLNSNIINKKCESKEIITSSENQSTSYSKPRPTRKSKPVKKSQVGSSLLFKINKKKALSQTSKNVPNSKQEIYSFEDTQDNTEIIAKPISSDDKNDILDSDNESLGYADSIGADAKSVSSVSSVSALSSKKPETSPENITKKKYKIMGKIFRNAAKSKIDEIDEELRNIPEIPEIDNLELVENYVRSCQRVTSPFLPPPPPPPLDELPKKPKMTEEEMNLLFDQLLGKETNELKNESSNKISLAKVKPDCKTADVKKKNTKTKNRKRPRVNSDCSDDEFNINRTAKKRSNKKSNQEDSGINLELELKECIGVASRKSQRKCTSGKQNVLVEYWSSDEEAFEAMLENQKLQARKIDDRKKSEQKKSITSEMPREDPRAENYSVPVERPLKTKPAKKKIQPSKKNKAISNVDTHGVDSNLSISNRRKRAAANPLYHWSSSSEDESQSLIEVKPIREEDDEEDRPVQHGWIVGDSPKKLVTMLALTKGKKTDIDSVKEQGKRRTSNTVS